MLIKIAIAANNGYTAEAVRKLFPMTIIHDYLTEWLKEHHLHLKDLAETAGVHPSSLTHYRNQNRPYPSEWIAKWKYVYKLTPDEISRLFFVVPRGVAV